MLSFRPFCKNDASLVASWISSEEDYYKWCAGHIGAYPFNKDMLLVFEDDMRNTSRAFWMVACEDDKPCGFIQLRYPGETNDVVRLGFIIIDTQFRGKGYGKQLLKLATDYAFNFLNARKITLGVFEKNTRAFRTYVAAGFSLTKSSHSYEIMGEEWVVNEMVLYSTVNGGKPEDKEQEEEAVEAVFKNNSFIYAFQPIVSATTGNIYAYEALMRAQNDGINVPPLEILDYASKHERLYEVEKATLFNVFGRYENSLEEFKDRKVFINSIPGYQLTEEDYAKFSAKYKKYFKNAIIEVTEMTDFKDSELDTLLERSARDGFGLAIDDYGTGYSNTSSLLTYLPDCVKMDRLLITNINEDTKKQHFVKGMVEFAHTNGFKVLAEGVETSAELRTVIDMGVDLIQGFYTARPSFEVIDEIDSEVRNEILSSNNKSQTVDTRKIYVVNDETELPLMRLALEQYTGMLIARSDFTLVGNTKYCADMSIKIKDGTKCRLTIKDVFLESVMQLPCIELGNKSELTLILEGENKIRKLGILVPKDAKLNVEGDGNMFLRVQGIRSYGIGNDYDGTFGNITLNGRGSIDVLVEADDGIGIGGGKVSENSSISILNGVVRTESACGNSISIGSASGTVPIIIDSAKIQLDMKTDNGIGIGCGSPVQNTVISNSDVNIIGAGAILSAIGSNQCQDSSSKIKVKNSEITVSGNGQKLVLLGSNAGPMNIKINESILNLRGEGNEVVCLGTRDEKAIVEAANSKMALKVSAGTPIALGADKSLSSNENVEQKISINE